MPWCCCNRPNGRGAISYNGVVIIPPYGVTPAYQDIDILMYVFTPEKPPSLVGHNIT
jgi:hypothetical protein